MRVPELIFGHSSPTESLPKTWVEVLDERTGRPAPWTLHGGCDPLEDKVDYKGAMAATAHRMFLYSNDRLWSVCHSHGMRNTIFVGTREECHAFANNMTHEYMCKVLRKGHANYDAEFKVKSRVLGLQVRLFDPTFRIRPYNKCDIPDSQMPVLQRWRELYL